MTQHRKPTAALGRADLLRYLAAAPPPLEIPCGGDGLLWRQQATPVEPKRRQRIAVAAQAGAASAGSAKLLPRHQARLFGVIEQQGVEEAQVVATPPSGGDPLHLAAPEGMAPEIASLTPWPRLHAPLLRFLRRQRKAEIDIEQLIASSSTRQSWLSTALPRRKRPVWPQQLTVVFDAAAAALCYRWDHGELLTWLKRWRGGSALEIFSFDESAAFPLRHIRGDEERPVDDFGAHLGEGQQVLFVADLGRLGRKEGSANRWSPLIAAARRRQCDISVFAPMSTADLRTVGHSPLLNLPLLRWGRAGALRAEAFRSGAEVGARDDVGDGAGLQLLLHIVALLSQVDIALLRQLRRAHPLLANDAGLEKQLLQHPAMDSRFRGYVRQIGDDQREGFLQPGLPALVASFDAAQQRIFWRKFFQVWLRHRRSQNQALLHEEVLRFSACLGKVMTSQLDKDEQAQWVKLEQDAFAFFAALPRALREDDGMQTENFTLFVLDMTRSADGRTLSRFRNWLAPAYHQACMRHYGRAPDQWPRQLGPFAAQEIMAKSQETWLVQQGDGLYWQTEAAQPGQALIAGPITCSAIDVAVEADGAASIAAAAAARPWRLADVPCRIADLAQLPQGGRIVVRTATTTLQIGELGDEAAANPVADWALEWGMDQNGPYALMPRPDGPPLRVDPNRIPERTIELPNGVQMRQGVDGYGLWLDIPLTGVTQRFRWIPPGEFLMGSPEDEPERDDREGPQHRVVLTQGYWLADTACTQELWLAVMGNNPSRFNEDEQNPVEEVSWDDCQRLLSQLNGAGGIEGWCFALPTEAQWEYACRAGTKTPFWWGSELTPEDANYDYSVPYAGGKKGKWRGKTEPVKRFKPNPWGLCQMHGNVREWCADGKRDYRDEVETDPGEQHDGPGGRGRALRGGSWFNFGRFVRAAYRDWSAPDYRDDDFGVRLALRSSSQGGPGRPDQPARRAAGTAAKAGALRAQQARLRKKSKKSG